MPGGRELGRSLTGSLGAMFRQLWMHPTRAAWDDGGLPRLSQLQSPVKWTPAFTPMLLPPPFSRCCCYHQTAAVSGIKAHAPSPNTLRQQQTSGSLWGRSVAVPIAGPYLHKGHRLDKPWQLVIHGTVWQTYLHTALPSKLLLSAPTFAPNISHWTTHTAAQQQQQILVLRPPWNGV